MQGADGAILGVLTRGEAERAIAMGDAPALASAAWIDAETSVARAQACLIEAPTGFLCLGDAEKKHLAGIVTLHDLLRGQETLVEDEATT